MLQAVEEHHKLMKDQAEIERKSGLKVQGLTLFDTIFEVSMINLELAYIVNVTVLVCIVVCKESSG